MKKIFKKYVQIPVLALMLAAPGDLCALSFDTAFHAGGALAAFTTNEFQSGAIFGTPSVGVRLSLVQQLSETLSVAGYLDPRFAVRGYSLPGAPDIFVHMNYLEASFGMLFGVDLVSFRFGAGVGLGYGELLSVNQQGTGYTDAELFGVYTKGTWFFEIPFYAGLALSDSIFLDFSMAFGQSFVPVHRTLYREYNNTFFNLEAAVTYRMKLF